MLKKYYNICPFQATYLHFVRTKIRLVAMIVNFCLVWCFNFISRFHPRDSMHRIYWTGLFTHSALARPTSGMEPSTTQILLLEKRLFRTRMIKIWPWCVARRKITLWLKMKKVYIKKIKPESRGKVGFAIFFKYFRVYLSYLSEKLHIWSRCHVARKK